MKTGLTLTQLAKEIERQRETKRDMIVQSPAIVMQDDLTLNLAGQVECGVNDLAHNQIGTYTGIPAAYYSKMREQAPQLLATNVNSWMTKFNEPRLVRTLDGRARAVLSDRYRPLENADFAEATLPVLMELGVEIMSCEITEKRLYIKAIDVNVRRDMPTGKNWGDGSHHFFDTVSPAVILSNSEVGEGALKVEAGVFTKLCTNMAIAGSRSMKKYHIGKKHEMLEESNLQHLLSDRTKAMQDITLWATVADMVRGAFNEAKFDAYLDEIKGLGEAKMTGDPLRVVEFTGKRFSLNATERSSVLKHLIEGGDTTAYGLFNAVTRTAQDLPDYDRATELERIGGAMIDLPKSEWKELLAA